MDSSGAVGGGSLRWTRRSWPTSVRREVEPGQLHVKEQLGSAGLDDMPFVAVFSLNHDMLRGVVHDYCGVAHYYVAN